MMIQQLNDKRGAALVVSFFVVMVLLGLTACFSLVSISELNSSNRYLNSADAFCAAETAINRFIQDTTMLDGGDETFNVGPNSVFLTKDDSDPQIRTVTATGTADGISRSISVTFPAIPPTLFGNTISSGGGITLDGFIAGMDVDGKTRLTGAYDDQGFITSANFEDKEEGVDNGLTTLRYPDTDTNGTADEFTDFVAYNRRFVDSTDPDYTGEYTSSEVLHIQSNNTVNIWPSSTLVDKRIVFVEGSTAGSGDVNIWFDSSWQSDQNLTVISTGSVNYIQPLQNPSANSQLNTISWNDYNEVSVLYSAHSGVTYAHDAANFGSIISYSDTDGNLIANDNISLDLIFVWKEFDYENPIDENDNVPPAFQGLVTGGSSAYSLTPNSWTEI